MSKIENSSNMAPVLLAHTQIPELLKKLEDFGDQSFQIRSTILFQKQYMSQRFKVWVDVWPEFTTIVIKKQLSENLNDIYYIFTVDEKKLKNMLENTDIVEWENALFQAYPYDYHQIIEEITRKRGFGLRCEEDVFRLYKFNETRVNQRSIPEYFTVGALSPEMVDFIIKCKPSPFLGEKSARHLSYLISTYPSICVFDENGTPIAFEIEYEYGAIGMLFVQPEYRRRGLGKLITTLFLKKCADFSYSPFVIIRDDNEISIQLHIDLGFQKTNVFLFSSMVLKEKA